MYICSVRGHSYSPIYQRHWAISIIIFLRVWTIPIWIRGLVEGNRNSVKDRNIYFGYITKTIVLVRVYLNDILLVNTLGFYFTWKVILEIDLCTGDGTITVGIVINYGRKGVLERTVTLFLSFKVQGLLEMSTIENVSKRVEGSWIFEILDVGNIRTGIGENLIIGIRGGKTLLETSNLRCKYIMFVTLASSWSKYF